MWSYSKNWRGLRTSGKLACQPFPQPLRKSWRQTPSCVLIYQSCRSPNIHKRVTFQLYRIRQFNVWTQIIQPMSKAINNSLHCISFRVLHFAIFLMLIFALFTEVGWFQWSHWSSPGDKEAKGQLERLIKDLHQAFTFFPPQFAFVYLSGVGMVPYMELGLFCKCLKLTGYRVPSCLLRLKMGSC